MQIPKISLRIAQSKYNRFPFNTTHHTTSSFGEFRPVFYRHLQPGDKLSLSVSDMIRTEPLVYPTYGEVVHKMHAFFVPYRLLYRAFKDFIEGNVHPTTSGFSDADCPQFSPDDLRRLFLDNSGLLMKAVENGEGDLQDFVDNNLAFDVALAVGYRTYKAYRYTSLGRRWLKIFQSLGYSFNWLNLSHEDSLQREKPFNAFALLGFLQIYLDYFCPSDFAVGHPIHTMLEQAYASPSGSWFTMMRSIITQVNLPYDLDYFTSAWESFNSTLHQQDYNRDFGMMFKDPSVSEDSSTPKTVQTYEGGFTYQNQDGSSPNFISAYGMRLLQQVANYVNRNSFAGARSVEKLLARFGIKVPEYTMDRCVYEGSSAHLVQISDIQNLAESEYAELGQYAGRMIGASQNQKFDCEAREYGVFIIVATIMPKIDYFQGYDKANCALERFDFYTPEFAKLGNEPIEVGELYADFAISSENVRDLLKFTDTTGENPEEMLDVNFNNPINVYGFMQRYAHLKIGRSFVTGDYRVGTLAKQLEPYHLNRIVHPDYPLRAKSSFIYVDSTQYDRIFNVSSEKMDQFYPIYYFRCNLVSKMESFADSTPITDGDGSMDVNLGGSQLN